MNDSVVYQLLHRVTKQTQKALGFTKETEPMTWKTLRLQFKQSTTENLLLNALH